MPSLSDAWRELDESSHRAQLYRAWQLGAAAGFTVPRSMETIGMRESGACERARRWLLDDALQGRSVQESVTRAGAPFSGFERGLLSLGSETGQLEQSLRLLADFHERRHRTMLHVRQRLAHPLLTVICASFIGPVPLLFTGHSTAYAAVVIVALLFWLTVGGIVVRWAAEHCGHAPPLARARLARSLATAVQAGFPLDRAVRLAAEAADDDGIRRFVSAISDRRLGTQSLAASLSGCPHLTPEFLAVLANAERTGDFTESLGRMAMLYEDGFR